MMQTVENRKRRFVVLLHKFPRGHDRVDHWDLMLEDDAGLLTWALRDRPHPGCRISAIRLADHRKRYLEFEGAISGDRGCVTQVLSGHYVWNSSVEHAMATLEIISSESSSNNGILQESTGSPKSTGSSRWKIKFAPTDADVGDVVTISIQAIAEPTHERD